MLQIRFANRFERLLDALLDALDAPPASAFARAEVIVPSAALRRRVELAAADRFGICANVEFSFLAQWLWRQIGRVIDVAETSPFTGPVLTWRVLGIFADPSFVAAHPPLAAYLAHAGRDAVMRYELAARTASLLEQYLTYRPDWLAAWLAGERARIRGIDAARAADEAWQGALWQRIARDLGTGNRHPSAEFFTRMDAMGADAPVEAGLPAAARIFCLPTTPPLYLDILRRLARWIDIDVYVLNPCREYWGEIVDARRLAYLEAHARAEHHEVGNRLLAAWGRQTQAHIDLLFDDAGEARLEHADFVASGGSTLLARLQDAILDLTELPPREVALAAGDRSIEVHVCHSLTRELEVLQDQLLALFAGEAPPRPGDVLVVLPDLEAGAPLIDAVFGNAPRARAIPYTITGRPASAQNPCAQALLAVLAVAASRFHASAVFELLQQPVIARCFDVGDAERDAIHAWIREAGIRWGLDAAQRADLGLPREPRHSFADGLDRLFQGYALPASATAPLNGRLPAGDAEGSAALALGSFAELVRRLARVRETLRHPAAPDAWRRTLQDVLEAFVLPVGDEIDDLAATTGHIRELHENMVNGGAGAPLEADVVIAALKAQLDDPTRGGMPAGAVTFAAMSSLRSLPYRVVCVLGMNDGAYPSTQRPAEFDLMAIEARRGDRQRRTDERNVFLDLLLAARERLYLSYTGRSVRDNAPLPPSVLVAELLDYVTAAIDPASLPAGTRTLRERLVVQHPLQPFAAACFEPTSDPRVRSFNEEYCGALRERPVAPPSAPATATAAATAAGDASAADARDENEDANGVETQRPFFAQPLAAAGPEFRDVTLDALLRFLRNPCRYLLRERLGITLAESDEELDDDEPFVVDWTARDALAARVLPRMLAGEDAAAIHAYAYAGVEYPAGRIGEVELAQELARLRAFATTLAPALTAPRVDPIGATLEFALDGAAWRLAGSIGDARASGWIGYRYDDVRPRDYLEGWVRHLFLNALAPDGIAPVTQWHSRDGCYLLRPVADARERLAALLTLYRDGLDRPLHFFPKAAWAFVTNDGSLAKARGAWESTRFHEFGEERDAAYRLALRGVADPLDDEFAACATAVFAPLLQAIDDERLT
jgi:exodeoxyribonuclease V gamma subunit